MSEMQSYYYVYRIANKAWIVSSLKRASINEGVVFDIYYSYDDAERAARVWQEKIDEEK